MIGHVRRHSEGLDADDNPVSVFADPVPFTVSSAEPGPSRELGRDGRDVQQVAWTLTVPRRTVLGERDVIVWQGSEYRVDGRPLDWTLGPWPNPAARIQVGIRRVTG